MTADQLRLHMSENVRATLVQMLTTALDLVDADSVADHLPVNPWGDVDEFRRAVYLPLHGEPGDGHLSPVDYDLVLGPDEIVPVRDVLDGLAESISGGIPWVALTDRERLAVESLLARLADRVVSAVKPYTDIASFRDIVLEESFVLGISATPSCVTVDVEFALTPDHPAYAPPPPDENEAYRRGQIRFVGVRRLVWEDQGLAPATDATGEADYGHVDDLRWDDETFELEGEWGRMSLEADGVEVDV